MSNHTPGPWDSDPDIDGTLRAYDGAPICVVCAHNDTEANALLIAAAPDLLSALRLAVRQNEHDMLMTGEELRTCLAAIAKAEGTAPPT
jgi:molybdopterin-guanine dinucleotide biosynthesis protein A